MATDISKTVSISDSVKTLLKITCYDCHSNNRNQNEVEKVLREVEKVAASGENIMPTLIRTVKAKATLGEIINVMKKVFGEYKGVSCLV